MLLLSVTLRRSTYVEGDKYRCLNLVLEDLRTFCAGSQVLLFKVVYKLIVLVESEGISDLS